MIGEKVEIRMVPRRKFAILTTRASTTAIHSHSQGQGPKVLAHSIVHNVPPGLSLMKNIPLGDGCSLKVLFVFSPWIKPNWC
jgi:hypothetical protein